MTVSTTENRGIHQAGQAGRTSRTSLNPKDIPMKLALVVIVALLGGCVGSPLPPPNHGRLGATATDVEWLPASSIPAITGSNSTVVLFSMSGGRTVVTPGAATTVNRIGVSIRCDQPITLLSQVNRTSGGGSTWRTMNNNGSGDTVLANTDTAIDYLVFGPNTRIEAVTGSTGPSACETDIGLFVDRQPGI